MCSHSKIGLPAICLYLTWFTQGKGFFKKQLFQKIDVWQAGLSPELGTPWSTEMRELWLVNVIAFPVHHLLLCERLTKAGLHSPHREK